MIQSIVIEIEDFLREEDVDRLISELYRVEEPRPIFSNSFSPYEFNAVVEHLGASINSPKTLVQYLIEKMAEKNLIQQEVADRADLSKSYLSNVLSGAKASKYKLIRIAMVLELDLKSTKELLELAGFTFNFTLKDKIIVSCLSLDIIDLIKVEEILQKITNGT